MDMEINGKTLLDFAGFLIRAMAEQADREKVKARFIELLNLDNPSEEDLAELKEDIDAMLDDLIDDGTMEKLDEKLKISETIDTWIENDQLEETDK